MRTNQHLTATATLDGGYEHGSAKWSLEPDDGTLTLAVDPNNELSATLTSGAQIGTVTVTLALDADQDTGEGEVKTLTAIGAVSVIPADATTLDLSFGTASDNNATSEPTPTP